MLNAHDSPQQPRHKWPSLGRAVPWLPEMARSKGESSLLWPGTVLGRARRSCQGWAAGSNSIPQAGVPRGENSPEAAQPGHERAEGTDLEISQRWESGEPCRMILRDWTSAPARLCPCRVAWKLRTSPWTRDSISLGTATYWPVSF